MNSVELIRLMNRPRLLDDQTLVQIRQMLEKFPFCQCLRMLYLKNLHLTNLEEFNTFLNNNATLITDRAKLFQIIYGINEQPLIPDKKSEMYSIEDLARNPDNDEPSFFYKEHLSKDELLHSPLNQSFGKIDQQNDDGNEPVDPNETGESLYNEMDFVTETLAEIFVRKGKYEDAIKTYQKLCLKYPEKNSYFASRIENLKNNL